MAMPQQIYDLLRQKPSMNSNEIAQALNAKVTCVKVTLHKMVKSEKLVREKVARAEKPKAGPSNVYAYKINAQVVDTNANPQ